MVGKIVKRDEVEFDSWLKKRRAAVAETLQKMGMDPGMAIGSELGWLMSMVPKFQDKGLVFDFYQARFLSTRARKRSVLKARQIGFSFEIGCEALARSHQNDRHRSIFISYNLDDAKEKISLVKELHEELPLGYQKTIVTDSKTEVSFRSNDSKRRLSRIISNPAKAPRGKTGDVYLDEYAHSLNDRQIYQGSSALILRSRGQLTIGSTPLGKRGMFHAIHSNESGEYVGFWRQEIPWWLCSNLCTNVREAAKLAPFMTTVERVSMFGRPSLIEQFDMLPIEDFQQEYELVFQDERVSFFPIDLILPCLDHEAVDIPVYDDLESLVFAAPSMGPLEIGFDVGRVNHPSELTVVERSSDGRIVMRYRESYRNRPIHEQEARVVHILDRLEPFFHKMRGDATGLGRQVMESLHANRRWGWRVEPWNFSNQSKERLMNSLKRLFQEKALVLPRDKDLRQQIHSIKQKITASGNSVFDAERSRTHHGDRAWSLALASYREAVVRERRDAVVECRVIGEKKLAEAPLPAKPVSIESLDGLGEEALKRRMRTALVAAKVCAQNGMPDKARELKAEYERIRRRLKRVERVVEPDPPD